MSVRTTIDSDAMCCPGCATNVVNEVTSMDGVDDADADHGAGEVTVVYEEDAVSEDALRSAIDGAGCGMG